MRVFLYEYACAQGPANIFVPDSVRIEGRAMLTALVEDFSQVRGAEVLTLSAQQPDERRAFQELAAAADWSLVIAPEFDEILLTRCRWVEEAGGRLLGPSPEVVRLAGDKWATFQLLEHNSVPTPPTWLEIADPPLFCVQKPRWGAGSQDLRLIRRRDEYQPRIGCIVQAYAPGIPASVAFLAGPRGLVPLRPGVQRFAPLPGPYWHRPEGHFNYIGGRLPLPEVLAYRAIMLGRRAVECLPDARGYIGVDLMLDARHGDQVIEINPRLTTSYVGLRALAKTNLAEAMLLIATGERSAPLEWHPGTVSFRANGEVQLDSEPRR